MASERYMQAVRVMFFTEESTVMSRLSNFEYITLAFWWFSFSLMVFPVAGLSFTIFCPRWVACLMVAKVMGNLARHKKIICAHLPFGHFVRNFGYNMIFMRHLVIFLIRVHFLDISSIFSVFIVFWLSNATLWTVLYIGKSQHMTIATLGKNVFWRSHIIFPTLSSFI